MNDDITIGNLSLQKIFIIALKYIPVISTAVLTLFFITPLTPQEGAFLEWVFSCSISSSVLLWIASYAYKFCNLHRCLIGYSFASYACIMHLGILGISEIMPGISWAMGWLGIILCGVVLFRRIKSKC